MGTLLYDALAGTILASMATGLQGCEPLRELIAGLLAAGMGA